MQEREDLFKSEVFTLSDGGKILLESLEPKNSKAIVMIVPGLTGTRDEIYVKNLTKAAYEDEITSYVINHRGMGVPLSSP